MKFTISAAAFLALVGSALAQTTGFDAILTPAKDQELTAGQTYPITWDATHKYNGQTVTIRLMQGADMNSLQLGADVVSGIDSGLGTYSWTVDSSLTGFATYGLKLQLDSDETVFQYSFPFHIVGDSSSSTTSSSSSSSSTSSGDSSSSSSSSSSSAVSSSTASSSSTSAATPATTSSSSASSGTQAPAGGDVSTTAVTAATTTAAAATAQTTLATATKGSPTGSSTASSSSPVQTAGAGKVVAGTFAAMGGVVAAAAVFAL